MRSFVLILICLVVLSSQLMLVLISIHVQRLCELWIKENMDLKRNFLVPSWTSLSIHPDNWNIQSSKDHPKHFTNIQHTMSCETLIHQRGLTKRKVTNLIKEIDQVTEKPVKSDFNVICAEQYLNEIRTLDSQFQQQQVEASALVELSKDFEELDAHNERVPENVSRLLYLLSVASTKPQETKSNESKGQKSLEAKWNRLTKNINDATTKIIEAQTKLEEMEIEDLTDTRSHLSELEKSLDQFTTDIDSLSPDLEDADGDKWNDAISYHFDKIKTTQDTLAQMITDCRRNLARENQERQTEREYKRSNEIEVQNSQHRKEIHL